LQKYNIILYHNKNICTFAKIILIINSMKKLVLLSGILILSVFVVNLLSCKEKEEEKEDVKKPEAFNHKIGETYNGGILAYIYKAGDSGYDSMKAHGIIAAPSDYNVRCIWGRFDALISGTSTALGKGALNTTQIVNNCAEAAGAIYCDTLTLNGYTDWCLPSKDDLNKLYLNKDSIGGFSEYWYWSSSESNANFGWRQDFRNGIQSDINKTVEHQIRAIRYF
jgi:hypothetical protein